MNNRFLAIAAIVGVLLLSSSAWAIQESRPLPIDSRFRVITYLPGGIHKYTGFYDYQASILFEEGEEISTIAMGVTTGWYINPVQNRMFIKPISDQPIETNTNMLIITNKRTYHFLLEAAEATGIDDPNLVWETRFVYAETGKDMVTQLGTSHGPDLSDPDKNYNFNYSISGDEYIAPLQVFDDGEFTYFKFPQKNADLPAFFLVDSDGREALVNFRIEGDYVVLERVTSQLTLRHGSDVTCVFNESRPFRRKGPGKKA